MQIQAVVDLFHTLQPNYSTLNESDRESAKRYEQTLTVLAKKLPNAQIPNDVDETISSYARLSQVAVIRGRGFGGYEMSLDDSIRQWNSRKKEIDLLREDLREFGKEERMEALRSELEASTRRPQEGETDIHTPAAGVPVREQAPTETRTARQTAPAKEKSDLEELEEEQRLADGKPQKKAVKEKMTEPIRQREKGEISKSAGK